MSIGARVYLCQFLIDSKMQLYFLKKKKILHEQLDKSSFMQQKIYALMEKLSWVISDF